MRIDSGMITKTGYRFSEKDHAQTKPKATGPIQRSWISL
jgi:hypothetical protein